MPRKSLCNIVQSAMRLVLIISGTKYTAEHLECESVDSCLTHDEAPPWFLPALYLARCFTSAGNNQPGIPRALCATFVFLSGPSILINKNIFSLQLACLVSRKYLITALIMILSWQQP